MIRIAIVGANGFVGNRAVEMLHLSGEAQVRPIVRRASAAALPRRFDLDVRVADARDRSALAAALQGHPAVERVDHPSLTSHPAHVLAEKLFDPGRRGAVVTVHPKGGRDAGLAFADRLRTVTLAASLGGTHTLAAHVATTSHRNMSDADLAAAGISPGAVRFSIGLEDPQDLIEDALQALGNG